MRTRAIRQQATWCVDVYLNEAGWDGTHEQYYFGAKRDANAFAEAAAARIAERVKKANTDHWLEIEVYQVGPVESSKGDLEAMARHGRDTADSWLEGQDMEDDEDDQF